MKRKCHLLIFSFFILFASLTGCEPRITHEHEWSEWKVTTPATCMATGVETRTCALESSSETRTIPVDTVNGHRWAEWSQIALAATCEEPGSGTRFCRLNAGHSDTGNGNIEALGHNYQGWTQISSATCTEAAVQEGTCTRNNTHTTTRAGANALGHEWQLGPSSATCEGPGKQTATCTRTACTQTETRDTDKKGHNYQYTTTATCTAAGTISAVCLNDGSHTIAAQEQDAFGHLYTVWNITKEPTYIVDGSATSNCARDVLVGGSMSRCNNLENFTLYAPGNGEARIVFTFIDNRTAYRVSFNSGSLDSGELYIPAWYRPFGSADAVPYLPVTEIAPSGWSGIATRYNRITILESGGVSQLKTIGDSAFSGCTGVTNPFTIPASVTAVGKQAFYGWTATQTIQVRGYASEAAADAAWGVAWREGCNATRKYWNGSAYQ